MALKVEYITNNFTTIDVLSDVDMGVSHQGSATYII